MLPRFRRGSDLNDLRYFLVEGPRDSHHSDLLCTCRIQNPLGIRIFASLHADHAEILALALCLATLERKRNLLGKDISFVSTPLTVSHTLLRNRRLMTRLTDGHFFKLYPCKR
jgi:hypothetical protein